MKLNLDQLQRRVDSWLITKGKHPKFDIRIYNYTPECQYSRSRDEYTIKARWLILDEYGNTIAIPFPKFFNREELETKPVWPYKLYEKLDGSLGIMYWYADEWHMATRGSFISDQAIKGLEIVKRQERDVFECKGFCPTTTYLWEIIYPENRIVVNYGNQEKCVLLWWTLKETWDRVTCVSKCKYHARFIWETQENGVEEVKARNNDNEEGYVGISQDGTMFKIKFDEYVRLHRIVTRTSSHTIREALKDWKSVNELLSYVPDEFHDRVSNNIAYFKSEYLRIEDLSNEAYAHIYPMATRKEQAMRLKQNFDYPWIVFAMLDNKDYRGMIREQFTPPKQQIFYPQ